MKHEVSIKMHDYIYFSHNKEKKRKLWNLSEEVGSKENINFMFGN